MKKNTTVVSFLSDEGGGESMDSYYHAIISVDAPRALCTGQVFGYGESDIEYNLSTNNVNCPSCIGILKYLRKYKV